MFRFASNPAENKSFFMRSFVEDSSHVRRLPASGGPSATSHKKDFCSLLRPRRTRRLPDPQAPMKHGGCAAPACCAAHGAGASRNLNCFFRHNQTRLSVRLRLTHRLQGRRLQGSCCFKTPCSIDRVASKAKQHEQRCTPEEGKTPDPFSPCRSFQACGQAPCAVRRSPVALHRRSSQGKQGA